MSDLVLGVGGFLLAAAVLPSFRSQKSPALLTCLLMTLILFTFVFAYLNLGQKLAAVSSAVNCVLWLVLSVVTYKQKD